MLGYNDFERWRSYFEASSYQKKNFVLGLLKRIFDFCNDFYGFRNKWVYQILSFKDYSIHKDFKEGVKILPFSDFKKFYDCLDTDLFRLMFLTGYFTGMRISEVRGLKVEAIHNSRIYVYQQACDSVGLKKTVLMSLKSISSKRSIAIPKFLYSMFQDWILSNKLSKDDFIFFGRIKGLPIGETTINRCLWAVCNKACISRFTFHYFRHNEATMLFEKGVNDKLIQEYLGHSSFDVTKKYYLHNDKDKESEVANILDDKYSSLFKK